MTKAEMNIRPWPELLEALPPLSTQEYKGLEKSIEAYGVLNSILVLPGPDNDARIVDGYHRWKITGEDTPYTCLDLEERSAFLLGLAINVSRRQMSPDQIKELRQRQKKMALELRRSGMSQEKVAAIVGVTQPAITEWGKKEAITNTEDPFRRQFAMELRGKELVRNPAGVADIQTETHVYEVEPVWSWKTGLGQAIAYASATGLYPGLALYGPRPKSMLAIEKSTTKNQVALLTKFWDRVEPIPGRLLKEWRGEPFTETQKRMLAQHGLTVRQEQGYNVLYSYNQPIKGVPLTAIPDIKIKVPKKERQRIAERVAAGESQGQIAADYKITQPRVSQIVQSVEKAAKSSQRRRELAEAGAQLITPEGIMVETGDFRELAEDIPSASIDLIFTDPSYGEDYLDLWSPLAELAARVLKPGRFLLTYCGKLYLPAILAKLGEHLQYYWLAGKYYDQGHSFFRSKKIWDQWRPILIYQKPGPTEHEWFLDMIRMGSREGAKELHDYGQSLEDARYYIQKLTVPKEVVLDVCCGSGTILLAAKMSNRKAIGFDVDESRTRITKGRLAEVVNDTPKVS